MKLPVFSHADADCDSCELKLTCHAGQFALAAQPTKPFNGIMILGEWASQQDVQAQRPFAGRNGVLLRQLLLSSGIDMDACYATNAVLGRVPTQDGSLADVAPTAIQSCLPRLEAEIAALKPRVILGFGNTALYALTGHHVETTKRVKFDCAGGCNADRKVGPVYQCHKCKALVDVLKHVFEDNACVDCGVVGDGNTDPCSPPQACHECNASMTKCKPKLVKCPVCDGKKTREETQTSYEHDYNLAEVAGMVVPGAQFGWDACGVKYVIPTFSPGFLLTPAKSEGSGEKKVMAGQFAAYSVQRHMQKALTLSKEDRPWAFDYEYTVGDGAGAANRLQAFVDTVLASQEHEISFDVETEAMGCAHYCNVCSKKSREDQITFTEGAVTEEPCPHCEEITFHTLETCELDARKLEQVSRIKVIGFGSRVLRLACVVDTREMRPSSLLAKKLKWLLTEEPSLGKVPHHGTYDVPVIERMWGYRVTGYTTDTLIKHHAVHADETHTLAHLAARYTFAPMWKPPKKKRGAAKHESFEELVEYNARDVIVTAEASYALDVEVAAESMEALHASDMALQQQALDMQANGLPLNIEAAKTAGLIALNKFDAALAEMRAVLNEPTFNPNAGAQLQQALYVTLSNAVSSWTKGGKSGNRKPSTTKDALVKLDDSPFKRALLDYKEADAVLKGYFDISLDAGGARIAMPGRGLNLWDDGRIHATWKPFGTVSGRFSSSPNFQNWQKWLKAMIACSPGRKIVGADFDQIELRVLGLLCGDAMLINKCMGADDKRKLEPEHDPHSFIASHVFKQYTKLLLKDPAHNPATDVKCKCQTCHRKNLRDLCKRVIYGLNYGAGEGVVLASIYKGGYYGPPISVADIRVIKEVIYKIFPDILTWREKMIRLAAETRELRDVFTGRRREYALGEIPSTEIANFPIQAGAAAIVNERGTLFYQQHKLLDPSSLYLAQIHDAIYYEVDAERADVFAREMGKTLTCQKSVNGSAPMTFSASGVVANNLRDAA